MQAVSASVMELLSRLAEAGRDQQPMEGSVTVSLIDVSAVRTLVERERRSAERGGGPADDEDTIWQALTSSGVPTSHVSRALQASLNSADKSQQTVAAAIYVSLLCTNGCPMFSLFDDFVFNKVLKICKDKLCASAASTRRARAQAAGNSDDEDEAAMEADNAVSSTEMTELCVHMLEDVAMFLRVMVLRELPDARQSIAQMLVDITVAASGDLQATVRRIALLAVNELLQPTHGNTQETAALLMRLLAPGIWTLDSQLRKMTVNFMRTALANSPDTVYAAAAAARYALLNSPDKADNRAVVVSAVSELAAELPQAERQLLVWFIARMSLSSKPSQRQLAVQAASQLLEAEGTFGLGSLLETVGAAAPCSTPVATSHTAPLGLVCMAVLVQRISDKHALVRAKALQGVGSAIGAFKTCADPSAFMRVVAMSTQLPLRACVASQIPEARAETPAAATPNSGQAEAQTVRSPGSAARQQVIDQTHAAEEASSQPPKVSLPSWSQEEAQVDTELQLAALMTICRRRVSDEKAPVRKQAVLLLEALLFLRASTGYLPSEDDIAAVEAATSDPLVSVRRSGLGVASHMLAEFPSSVQVATMWVRTALPLIRDADQSLQELLLEEFCSLVLKRCSQASSVDNRTGESTPSAISAISSVKPILAALATGGALVSSCASRACAVAASKRQLRAPAVCAGLQAILDGASTAHESLGSWRMLINVSAHDPSGPSWEFLHARWQTLSHAEEGAAVTACGEEQTALLRVIANAAVRFPRDEADRLGAELLQALLTFRLPPAAASAHVEAITKLSKASGDGSPSWILDLLKAAEVQLAEYTSQDGPRSLRARASVQEVSAVGMGQLQPEDFRAVTALFIAGELALLGVSSIPGRLLVATQALTAPHIIGEASAAVDSAEAGPCGQVKVPGPVQAHTWTALGKMCLADKALAKKCLPLFVQELGRSELPEVRNNIVVALADMCVHFTALVDAHMPRIAACIRDPCELVRRQTLALLVHLLQKDFVKWRGVLFHRFLLSLVDPSPAVVQLASYLLGTVLGPKASLVAYNHFVEAIFVLNNCKAGMHAAAIASVAAGPTELNSGNIFSLEGASAGARAKRLAIYKVSLQEHQGLGWESGKRRCHA